MKKMVISLLIVIIIMSIMILIPFYLKKQSSEYDISNYVTLLESLKNKREVKSKLLIFPLNSENIIDFKYESRKNIISNEYYLYVVTPYNNDELNRISSLVDNKKIIKYNNTYIAIYDRMGLYEYVIFEDDKIIYLFNQSFNINDMDVKKDYILEVDNIIKYGYNIYGG